MTKNIPFSLFGFVSSFVIRISSWRGDENKNGRCPTNEHLPLINFERADVSRDCVRSTWLR